MARTKSGRNLQLKSTTQKVQSKKEKLYPIKEILKKGLFTPVDVLCHKTKRVWPELLELLHIKYKQNEFTIQPQEKKQKQWHYLIRWEPNENGVPYEDSWEHPDNLDPNGKRLIRRFNSNDSSTSSMNTGNIMEEESLSQRDILDLKDHPKIKRKSERHKIHKNPLERQMRTGNQFQATIREKIQHCAFCKNFGHDEQNCPQIREKSRSRSRSSKRSNPTKHRKKNIKLINRQQKITNSFRLKQPIPIEQDITIDKKVEKTNYKIREIKEGFPDRKQVITEENVNGSVKSEESSSKSIEQTFDKLKSQIDCLLVENKKVQKYKKDLKDYEKSNQVLQNQVVPGHKQRIEDLKQELNESANTIQDLQKKLKENEYNYEKFSSELNSFKKSIEEFQKK